MKIPKGGVLFFDSGIGGLTVLEACRARLKGQTFYYYGDNDRAPYGNLPPSTIRSYVFSVFERLSALSPSVAVVACNTATAVCVEELRARFSFPVIGIEPAVALAARSGGEILTLCTRATFNSPRFQALCLSVADEFLNAHIRPVACEGLAGEIEQNLFRGDAKIERHLPRSDPDVVVLGCTHYTFVKERIATFYRCPVFDGNEGVATRLATVLTKTRETQPLVTQMMGEGLLGSAFEEKTTAFSDEKGNEIFFLGSRKKYNCSIYEQTFGEFRK